MANVEKQSWRSLDVYTPWENGWKRLGDLEDCLATDEGIEGIEIGPDGSIAAWSDYWLGGWDDEEKDIDESTPSNPVDWTGFAQALEEALGKCGA